MGEAGIDAFIGQRTSRPVRSPLMACRDRFVVAEGTYGLRERFVHDEVRNHTDYSTNLQSPSPSRFSLPPSPTRLVVTPI